MTTKVVQDDQEPARLAALRELDILDTPEERRFDEITALAARVFRVPISLVSLVDETRQWFKSNLGLTARETSREVSFCAHAIADDGVLVVEDALLDPRFRDNSLVTGAPNIRFYAGAPLKTKDGHRLGTLCIIDSRPRSLSEEEAGILRDMADMVMSALFERIGSPAALDSPNWVEQKQLLELSEKFAEVGHWRIDLAKNTVYWSDEVYRIHGVSPETFEPELTTAIEFYHPDDRDEVAAVVGRAIEAKQPFEFELRLVRADGEIRQVRSVGECSDGKDGKNPFVFGVFQDVTDLRLSSERLRESEARFQLAVEGSSVGLWDWKIESEELFWSPRFKEILAIDDPEFKPELEEFETRLHADDHDRVMAALNAHFKERQPYNEEFRLRRQDGTYVW
ncbi:MAG: PAS domain-containing protein, partial [Pseudomonadota bacterium]